MTGVRSSSATAAAADAAPAGQTRQGLRATALSEDNSRVHRQPQPDRTGQDFSNWRADLFVGGGAPRHRGLGEQAAELSQRAGAPRRGAGGGRGGGRGLPGVAAERPDAFLPNLAGSLNELSQRAGAPRGGGSPRARKRSGLPCHCSSGCRTSYGTRARDSYRTTWTSATSSNRNPTRSSRRRMFSVLASAGIVSTDDE